MFLANVTAKEVFDIIKQVPKKTSSDLYNIPNELIKLSIQACVRHLQN